MSVSEPSDFRAWLKQQRAARGLTQEELGELVGYAGQTIRKIEGGQRRPSPQLALKLAQALQLSPAEHPAWLAAARADAAPKSPEAIRPPTPSLGLPAYLTPFVGREEERGELAALLARPDCRLITLLGPGGVGKTRLAIETVRAVSGFADGVTFVSLAPVAAPESIALAIGEAIGLIFVGVADPAAQLLAHLRERRTLIILDNLEHLLDSAGLTLGLLGRLLAHAPDVTILATSRERLKLAGEWVLELGGLALAHNRPGGQSDIGPALALFVEHAERVDRAFSLSPANADTVTRICRLVDGLPLGIELAATWLRLLVLEEIAQELTRGLDAVHLSPGALPPRHHSLRSVVEHSWLLLSTEERAVLRQLSVFQGGFTREAAVEVAGANIQVLANLADKSLLRRGGGGRYDLHEMIRQYADSRLRAYPDEYAATRSRHATYYLSLAAERGPRLHSPQQLAVMGELAAEIDNLRAAWGWAAAHGMLDELEAAGEALQWFCEYRSWLQEGVALFTHAIEQLRAVGPARNEARWRRAFGRLLGCYTYLAVRWGAVDRAHQAVVESYGLLSDANDPVGLARTLIHWGIVAHRVGDDATAHGKIATGVALTLETGDRWSQALGQVWASVVARSSGAYEEAERQFRAGLSIWQEFGDPRAQIWCITYCSGTLMALGKHHEVHDLLRTSLALSHATDDHYGTAMSLHHLGLIALQQRNFEEAIYFFREALPMLRRTSGWEYPQVFIDLGTALWEVGSMAESRRAYQDALAGAVETQALPEVLHALVGLAAHLARDGEIATALKVVTRVLADPAKRERTQRQAAELQAAARAALSADEAARIERLAAVEPLSEVVAQLTLSSVQR